MRRLVPLALAVVLTASTVGIYQFRRAYIRAWFVDGSANVSPPTLTRGTGTPLPVVDRVRVILLDGIGTSTARQLPRYSAFCAQGLDLIADVGFPTVSLPVQHVLWTGLTQQQSGVQYRLKALNPPARGIPSAVTSSVAISEAYVALEELGLGPGTAGPYHKIVHSFGFARAFPSTVNSTATSWRTETFLEQATQAVVGKTRLVFIHILRADTAGHRAGRTSAAYQRAAQWADDLLGQLRVADAQANVRSARWFVLSDHGHLANGGHGGAERSIRTVRACITGLLPPTLTAPVNRYVHLIDISRAIANSLGVSLDDRAVGRPLAAALSVPASTAATLPTPSLARWLLAVLALALAMVITSKAAAGRTLLLPWWFAVSYISVILIEGAPTLSMPMVYRPLGRTMYLAALPGLALLAIQCSLALRRTPALRVVCTLAVIPTFVTAAAIALSAGIHPLGGNGPPLIPSATAHASLLLAVLQAASAVLAIGATIAAARRWPHDSIFANHNICLRNT